MDALMNVVVTFAQIANSGGIKAHLWGTPQLVYCILCLVYCILACVEQPFDCLIAQNHQAKQSMRRSMDWTLEDNMVDDLFFCAIFTGGRGGHTLFVQAGEETSDTSGG